jgi:TolB-like protein/AraC-like DNA-binding protein/Tfp pilus assembly protein PilF
VPANSSIEEQFLKKLTELTEANITNEQFGVSELAHEMNMSRSNLHRKVISITKTSVSQFIRQHRLKRAMEMLQQTALTVSEVAYQVGFGSVTYFTKCFHDYFGFPPGEVGKRNLEDPGFGEHAIDAKQVKSGKRLKIALILASLLVIISATTLFLVFKPFAGKNKLEKSIAVLPFIDDSPEEGNTYIINGLREEILDKLEKISDLKVKSRTAAEKYKDSKLSMREIGRNLKVNYILEGSGQKIQDRIKVRLQLIEVQSGNHVWSKPYEEEVTDERIFELQEDVAFRVANELKAIIKPEEKEMVAKKPTENLAAYKLYLQGLDYLNMLEYNAKTDELEIRKAKRFFEKAIKLDTSFAEAYVRLAYIHMDKLWFRTQVDSIKEHQLDSGLMMANKALSFDDKKGWAYSLRGEYYLRKGMLEKARKEYDKSLEYKDKNYYGSYMGDLYMFFWLEEYSNALKSFYKYQELKPEEILTMPEMLNKVYQCYNYLGYPETARKYAKQLLQLNNDSLQYLYNLREIELYSGNFEAALDFGLKCHRLDTTIISLYHIGFNYLFLKNYTEAYKYVLEIENELKKSGNKQDINLWIGYIYFKNNRIKEADFHFDGGIKLYLKQIESNHLNAQRFYSQFLLACIYSVRGEKEKAMENLKLLKKRKTYSLGQVIWLKYFPLLDNIRQEPEFADILKDVEARYQKEHELAGKLLKEYGELE